MTNGERLYECLLRERPTQYQEWYQGRSHGREPRTPWVGLSETTQWSQEEWEEIARIFLNKSVRDGEQLYATVLQVNPEQRRVQSPGYPMKRQSWAVQWSERQAQWHRIAAAFLAEAGA